MKSGSVPFVDHRHGADETVFDLDMDGREILEDDPGAAWPS
jgi:hypothetical protein